jgi:O-antigen/teichoic acid export membrane protein
MVSLIFVCALLVTTISFLAWVPHWELFDSSGSWDLLIAIFVPGFFVALLSGLMLILLGVQAALGRIGPRRHRPSSR